MTRTKLWLFAVSMSCFCGCVGAVVEGVHITRDNQIRSENEPAARRGDRIAQYNLGESYCCSTSDSGPAYDTTVAVHWLCSSARQGYAPAMYKLGKIYTGDVIDGVRLLRRAVTAVHESATNSTVSMPIGYAWLRLAQVYGDSDAAVRLQNVKADMTASEIRTGESLAARGLSIPCEMKEVLPNN